MRIALYIFTLYLLNYLLTSDLRCPPLTSEVSASNLNEAHIIFSGLYETVSGCISISSLLVIVTVFNKIRVFS